jgi:hypothetical protein
MPTLTAEQRETLTRFACGADRLEEAIAGITENNLDRSSAPGEWTIRQIVHHLADDGDSWSLIFKKAIATPGASIRFEGFPGNEAWANALAFDKRSISTDMSLIRCHRRAISELAEHFCGSWEQHVLIVDSLGKEVHRVNALQIMLMLSEHLDQHIATIETIRRQHGI